ncbi:MAG: hypothetical protein MUF71_21790 [Candidatus Kapabacteria bacterium]|jgi:hypothetical protein|nr:hypothetical protein [Candidatus Kapabacteria bacterium]
MELEEMKTVWKQFDTKLDSLLLLNEQHARALTLQKVKSSLHWYIVFRLIEIVIGLLAINFLADIALSASSVPSVVVSALILCAFTVLGVSGCVNQIYGASQIDYAASIPTLQKNLLRLESQTLVFTRFLLLLLPLYSAYLIVGAWWLMGIDIVQEGNSAWWLAQVIFAIACLPLIVWLWRKISYQNIETPWVKTVIRSIGGASLTRAMTLVHELETGA